MRRVQIPEETLQQLYVEKELTSRQIAERFDCSKGTVLNRLREYGIPVRPQGRPRRDDITAEILHDLYIKKELSTREIADRLDTARSHVHRKLKDYNIPTRDLSTSHVQYEREPFSGDTAERSYLIGFAIGDLRARQIGASSETVKVDCGSTQQVQIDLFHTLFSDYGRIWEGGPYEDGSIHVEAFLDESFSFLLNAREQLSDAIQQQFPALLAGIVDADGSFFVTDGKACFALGTYDRELLETVATVLNDQGIITTSISEDPRIYETTEGYVRNDRYKQFQVNRKESLLNLVELLEPHVKHRQRKQCMNAAVTNIEVRNES